MRSITRNTWMVCALVGLMAIPALGQMTLSFKAVAVGGQGLPGGPGTYAEADPGDEIVIYFYLSDYTPTGVPMRAFQIAVDSAGYTSGTTGNVLPKDYDSTTAVGLMNTANALIDETNPGYIFSGLSGFAVVSSNASEYWYVGTMFTGGIICDGCEPAYLGTLILKVSDDASGTFVINADLTDLVETVPGPDNTFFNDEDGGFIYPYTIEPLTIQVGAAGPALAGSTPAMDESLWRNANNYMMLEFDGPVPALNDGDIMIREMLADGAYGEDLSANFTFTADGNMLYIEETGSVLMHEHWYAVSSDGLGGGAGFLLHHPVMVGDANNDGRLLPNDLSLINTMVPTFSVGPESRMDINGDTRVLPNDLSLANSNIPNFGVAKPSGH